MLYPPLDLRVSAIVTGLCLLVMYGASLLHATSIRDGLRAFPRSKMAGRVLLSIAAVWSFVLVTVMDLGEFTSYRRMLQLAVAAGYFLTLFYVEEFLAVRALGMLLLLMAEVLLEAAFLQPEMWRLLLVVIAYGMIIVGMFYVGMPYLMRDQIAWLSRSTGRWRACCWAGLAYAAVITLFGLIPRR